MPRWRIAVLLAAVALPSWYCARRENSASDVENDAGVDAGSGRPSDASAVRIWDVPDVSFVYDGVIDDAALTADSACAAEPVPAEPVPLDVYLMLDRSASMALPQGTIPNCQVGDTTDARWCYAINALAGFFGAPTSNGMGVALQFFPHGNCTGTNLANQTCCQYGDCCKGADDSVPAVPLGRLPGQLATLVGALNAQGPLGTTTPVEAALRGLVTYTAQAKTANRSMVGILVSDGDPNGCDEVIGDLAGILSTQLSTTGIKTFVIGMADATFQTLEQLAIAGGATAHSTYCAPGFASCHFFNVGAGQPEAFVDALQQIQRSVVGCRFALPSTDAGIVDPATLVVNVVSPANPDQQTLQHVASLADCGSGWYADANQPGEFALCPDTCTSVQAEVGVSVELLVGCLGS